MYDFWKSENWGIVVQLTRVLDFIDNCDDAEALLEYLEERTAEEEEE